MKKQALHLYLEGLGFRSIGKLLGVSNATVLNWIPLANHHRKDTLSILR
ncbi:hypothetical protein EZS27_017586 [termite gut metagenome]|uniref:Terminase ATPase subunit N-terminal domain-containing protein n=1 Tax=termite gut metagenome TaxID=433724 RepID=A0A5J4RMK1_9ZZZZ